MESQEALDLLASIDRTLKAMLALAQQRTMQARAAAPKPVASDRELDGQYGNPQIKFMPRDWTGPSFKGQRLSECPPALLDMLAETFDYFAMKAEQNGELTAKQKPVADYKRADAARARGWAKRMRDGVHPTPQIETRPSSSFGGDDDGGAEDAGFGDADESFT